MRRPAGWVPPLAVAAGGFVGSAARAGVGELIHTPDTGFPAATFAVNIAGAFILGWYLGRRQRAVSAQWTLWFWAIGVLGSFTTFSTFAVDAVRLVDVGQAAVAGAYVAMSLLVGIIAATIGLRVGRMGL